MVCILLFTTWNRSSKFKIFSNWLTQKVCGYLWSAICFISVKILFRFMFEFYGWWCSFAGSLFPDRFFWFYLWNEENRILINKINFQNTICLINRITNRYIIVLFFIYILSFTYTPRIYIFFNFNCKKWPKHSCIN